MKRRFILIFLLLGVFGTTHAQVAEQGSPSPQAQTMAKPVIRVYGLQSVLGPVPKEGDKVARAARAERWDSLVGLFEMLFIMAGCEQPRPVFGPDQTTNCLAVSATAEQIDLISQAIAACKDNGSVLTSEQTEQ